MAWHLAAAKGVPAAATGLTAIVVAQGSSIADEVGSIPGLGSPAELINGGLLLAAIYLLAYILRKILGPGASLVPREFAEALARDVAEDVLRKYVEETRRERR